MRAAMVGGVGYAAGRASANRAAQDAYQDEQIAQLQAQQAYAAPAPVAAAPAAAPAEDRVAQLTQLKELLDSGVLSQAEFEAEKARILQGG